jgi:GntR family transcriptional regulator, phosphonate transport system regulatory protein
MANSLWRDISRSIEQRIEGKEFCPGDKLPTEYELSRQFMVNRHTVRRALSYLQDKGMVESTQGRGTYVRRPGKPAPLVRRPRFTEMVTKRGLRPSARILRLDVRPAEPVVATQLELIAGQPVVYLERVRYVDEEPIGISQHHFSAERFPAFAEIYRARGSITETLNDSGVPDYTRRRTAISARLPTPQEADHLHLPRHVPVLVMRYLNVDAQGRPLEYGESRAATELQVDFGAADEDAAWP